MDKGIINHRKASITFTVDLNGPKDIVIKPGANRLSEVQYAALKKNKLFRVMFKPTERVESVTVPDPENVGEMKTQTSRRKVPAKLSEVTLDGLETAGKVSVHEGAGNKTPQAEEDEEAPKNPAGNKTPQGGSARK